MLLHESGRLVRPWYHSRRHLAKHILVGLNDRPARFVPTEGLNSPLPQALACTPKLVRSRGRQMHIVPAG